jgi:lipopolysaccharide/colanic/teichoic acid biosynthesis glycosyltransferase
VVGDERDAQLHGLADHWLGDVSYARDVLTELDVTGAIICAADLRGSELNRTVQELLDARAHVQLSSGLHGVDVSRLRPAPLAHEPLFYVEHTTLAAWQLTTKRVIDITLAVTTLVLTAPLLALAALGIKLQDRGSVLFKQTRIGRGGAPFALYKLRTMREGAEHETGRLIDLNARDGPLVKIQNDPRTTVLGRVLRATSIDELPQLWNVLNGTMSLVGPRPALPDEVVHFDAELRARESVLPGITGLWQVEGRDNPSFAAYRRFDLFYLQNWSVTLDVIILLGTAESVFTRVFHALVHRGEEIALAPPEAKDPAAQARQRLEPSEAAGSREQ